MNTDAGTFTVSTTNNGTLTWELPQGVTWKSLHVKTTTEELFQKVMQTVIPALAVNPEIGLPLVEKLLDRVGERSVEQLAELLLAQVQRNAQSN